MGTKATSLFRCGLAFTLASTLMVPAGVAHADPAGNADANPDAGLPTLQTDDRGEDALTGEEPDRGNVTIIVQLEEQSVLARMFGSTDESRHESVKQQIRALASDASSQDAQPAAQARALSVDGADDSGSGTEDASGLPQLAAQGGASDEPVQDLQDYYHVIDGFAVKAPAAILDDIRALDGVKNAFVETAYAVPVDQGSTGAAQSEGLQNQNSLDATGADKTDCTGAGQVIAVLDTGVDTDHEAFSGAVESPALDQAAAEAAGGTYVSEKIPFAWDYADGDADVNPGGAGMEHGTHVAGIAAANGGSQICGTAPDAQIAAMKVASDATGSLYDSAILAALDDCYELGVDAVNISLGANAGFSDAGSPTYADAFAALEDSGAVVNVAAGNSYTSAYSNQSGANLPYAEDPDTSMISDPASVSGAFSVASVGSDPLEIAEEGSTAPRLLATDGTEIAYWEAAGPDGTPHPSAFADLADGTYEVVWADAGTRSGIMGEVDSGTSVEGKIALVRGHYDFYTSIQSYARAVSNLSSMGAAAVILYDPALTEEQLEDVCLGGGVDEQGSPGASSWYDATACPAIFVTAEVGEALRDTAAAERMVEKASPAAQSGTSLTAADGAALDFAELTGPEAAQLPETLADLPEGTYEYVWGGIGRDDDGSADTVSASGIADENGDVQNGEDLTGKIVLVEGHAEWIYGIVMEYARAANYYAGLGAEAVILYDASYEPGIHYEFENVWYYDEGVCPAAIISEEQGLALRNAQTKTITVSHSEVEPATTAYYQVSSYSSWGVTPDLKLKPEVAAPGGNVYSSLPGGGYGLMSGTSMATPQMAGISAQIEEYVETSDKFASLSEAERADLPTQLLMSTATPLADTDDLSSYYSPRQQGAGLANVPAATATDVFAKVEGATNTARPKADLGESANGVWSFTVTLRNVGDADRTFAFDAAALSDTVADGLFQLQSKNWTGQGISVSASCGDQVSVPAGGSATVAITVTCDAAFTDWASANTPNGTFVDGFAFFRAADEGGVDLSVPFMGFYGDWSAANAFDADIDEAYHTFGTSLVDAETGEYLGVNPLDSSAGRDASKVDMDKLVISNSTYGDAPTSLTTQTGLLRNIDALGYELVYHGIVQDDGSLGDVSGGTLEYAYVPKTYYNATYDTWAYAEALLAETPVISGSDADVEFSFKETAITAGPTPETKEIEHTVVQDNSAPVITDVRYDAGDGAPTLTFTVEDDTYLAAIDFMDPETNGITSYTAFHRVLVDPDEALVSTEEDGTNVYKVVVSVDEVRADWEGAAESIPNVVNAYAWDYGVNPSSAAEAVVAPIAATGVSIDGEGIEVAPGQELGLTATLTPADTTEDELVWSVADESVATVSADGVLTGVAEGTTQVSVSVAANPALTDTAEVTVARVGAGEGIRLSADVKRVVSEGGTAEVSALLSDELAGSEVTWSVSDDQVASVAASEGASATVTGGYQVGDATVTATVTGPDGTEHSTSMTVQNRTADYDDFVIDEAGVLTKYNGVKSAIEIPNNVVEIADRLLYGNPTVEAVTIPASVKSIGDEAFAVEAIRTPTSYIAIGAAKTLTFEDTAEHPSQLASIGERAFADGGVTGEVIFPDSVTQMGAGAFSGSMSVSYVRLSDNLTEVPDNTFNQCVALARVAMSDKVTRIGAAVFDNCLYLENIDIIDTSSETGVKDVPQGVIPLPSALQEIGDSAFACGYIGGWIDEDGVTRGSKVTIPAGVKRIESGAFGLNTYIVEMEFNEGLEEIGQGAFSQTMIAELTLPDTVTALDWHALFGMTNLRELTLSKNLGDGELIAAIGEYDNSFNVGADHSHMNLETVNVPDDALNYSSRDGVVFNKDGSTLVYHPAMLNAGASYAVPEGTTAIASEAFADTQLAGITFPASLETVQASAIPAQFGTLDFGANVKGIEQNAFKQQFYADDSANAGYTPNHLIVRGGQGGSYADTQRAGNQQTAYFGPGMVSLDFSLSGAPGTLVVPADLESLNLSGNAANPSAVTVYAPADSAGWNVAHAALEAIGADPATQLKPYTALAARFKVTESEDGSRTIAASSEGGVGGVWYRFVKVNADGTEEILKDWGPESSYTLEAGADAAVRVEVRDATELTASAMAVGPAAPVISKDLSAEPLAVEVGGESPVLAIEASANEGAELAYQWYRDDVALEGATEASYAVPTDERGSHTYYCVVTATKDGVSVSTRSATATVMVGETAAVPTFAVDLAPATSIEAGEELALSVEAQVGDGGTLSYQWYRDGTPVEGAAEASLAVDTREIGTHAYYVVATNTLEVDGVQTTASAQSTTCQVTVTEVPLPAGDAATLATFVDRVDGLSADAYTPKSWASFAQALAAAQEVLADPSVAQTQLNAVLSDLQLAYRALEGASGEAAVIPDGAYDMTVSLRNASSPEAESMAGALLNPQATLNVTGDEQSVTVSFNQGATIMGLTAYLTDPYYYPDGYVLNPDGSLTGVGTPLLLAADEEDAQGRPLKVTIPLNDQAKVEGYLPLTATFEGMGTMTTVVALDWAAFSERYGIEVAQPADKAELNAAIAQAAGTARGEASEVVWNLLQRALEEARNVAGDAYASQAAVDAQAVALLQAVDAVAGVPAFDFLEGGVYDLPATSVDAQGAPLQAGFAVDVRATAANGGGYDVLLTASLEAGVSLEGITYGEGLAAQEITDGAGAAARAAAVQTQRFSLTADTLDEPLPVTYLVRTGEAAAQEVPGFLVFDTGCVDVVDESGVSLVDRAALTQAIADAAAIEQGAKTDEAFAALQEAVAAAQAVLDDPQATQTDVKLAELALKDAVAAFQASEDAGDPGTDPGEDPGTDPGTDPDPDPGTDPGGDPGTDPGTDPGEDPGEDPGTDPGEDPGTDPGAEPGTDPGTDPGADPGTDPGTDSGTDPDSDSGTGYDQGSEDDGTDALSQTGDALSPAVPVLGGVAALAGAGAVAAGLRARSKRRG